ncbi:MAG: serine protease [Pseudomonadota bacterium]
MIRNKLFHIAALMAGLAGCAQIPEPILETAYPSVVVVEVYNKRNMLVAMGSGVVVSEDRVITNCHVVQSGDSYHLRQRKKHYPAKLQYADQRRDLCLLVSPNLGLPAVEIVGAKDLKIGQPVYTVTAPAGFARDISSGAIISLSSHDGTPMIRTDAKVSPGSSGGGLFDDAGRLVGITTFIMLTGENNHTYAVPAELISEVPERAQEEIVNRPIPVLIPIP